MPDDCKHILNYEETHCCLCMLPTWAIADENGINKLSELEQRIDIIEQKVNDINIGFITNAMLDKTIKDIDSLREDLKDYRTETHRVGQIYKKNITELKELLKVDNKRIADNKLEILILKK